MKRPDPSPRSELEQHPPAPPGGVSDEELMMRFVQGDAPAFDALFERFAGPVQGYLARLTGNPSAAEDLTQVTFLSLVKARGRYRAEARVKPWLYAIATNAARDWHRRARPEELTREGNLPADAAADTAPSPDAGLERQVHEALKRLPESQRIPITLHRFEELSFSEIAETLGVTENAVKIRAHRGYERLRELLGSLRDDR